MNTNPNKSVSNVIRKFNDDVIIVAEDNVAVLEYWNGDEWLLLLGVYKDDNKIQIDWSCERKDLKNAGVLTTETVEIERYVCGNEFADFTVKSEIIDVIEADLSSTEFLDLIDSVYMEALVEAAEALAATLSIVSTATVAKETKLTSVVA
ncbi:MAG: hypothetical protein LBP59_10655 [Planctomycetaceae bacterium]|jgi:hypothetical protein|nr:hypothetical protein [Planctomycetaceae bacterium]